jgi:hypothetical protein
LTEKSQERFRGFWERQIVDRPVVQVYANKRPGVPKGWWRILDESVWADPDRTVEEMLAFFDGIHFASDAYPMWYPNLGPGALTAFLGNRIHFDPEHDTSWQDHTVSDLSSWRPRFDHQNAYWQATLRLTDRIAAAAPGRFIAGITDLGMGADLVAHCDWLDYAVYHLDGPGAVPHLDLLLEIPSLRAIQWTPGAGQPPMPHWLPMLRRIQSAGKGLFLYTWPEELDALMDGLKPEGVILNLWAGSPAEADALVDKVAAWR